MKKAGVKNCKIFDSNKEIGGTWNYSKSNKIVVFLALAQRRDVSAQKKQTTNL